MTTPQDPSPYQPQYPQFPPTETSGWAIFSLIAGVLAWLGVFGLGGIAAVIAGHVAKNQIRSSSGRVTGDGMATIGLVLGYVNIALVVLGLCLLALVVFGVISGAAICPFLFDGTNFNF
jgi:hypothetical protein